MNFARDVVEERDPRDLALIELARDGARREWSFGEVSERSARLAGALSARGVGKGDVVMTLIGNRPEWVLSMLACFRIGAVVLPCTEQLRATLSLMKLVSEMREAMWGVVQLAVSTLDFDYAAYCRERSEHFFALLAEMEFAALIRLAAEIDDSRV